MKMDQVETKKKRSVDTDPVVKRLLECTLEILDSQKRFLKQYPEYREKARKQREERLKRDPLADAW